MYRLQVDKKAFSNKNLIVVNVDPVKCYENTTKEVDKGSKVNDTESEQHATKPNNESIDDFIQELEALESSLENDKKDESSNTEIHQIAKNIRSSMEEENKLTEDFLKSVRQWRLSRDVIEVRSSIPADVRTRHEWFLRQFHKESTRERKKSVDERLQMRRTKHKDKESNGPDNSST